MNVRDKEEKHVLMRSEDILLYCWYGFNIKAEGNWRGRGPHRDLSV